ncbi:OmpA family protein [Acinetobacter indicus]|uniref:OmpA family protein n=1 Tax=Acinetobacter TaxID=469 RepID=UPI0015D1B394|nr:MULTISPECIES: OmpA family protein [Acinetobacter]MCP0917733.1 OmpA family protein [Acinetobacter indicus]
MKKIMLGALACAISVSAFADANSAQNGSSTTEEKHSAEHLTIKAEVKPDDFFIPLEKSRADVSPNVNYDQVNLLKKGLDKDGVTLAIGAPNFPAWFNANSWQYRMNISTPEGEAKDCLVKIDFEDRKSVSQLYTNTDQCADVIAYKLKLGGDVINNITTTNTNVRLPIRQEVHFAFNKHQLRDVTNDVNWDDLAARIKSENAARVQVIGTTDQKGSYVYNLELASKRSDTVSTNLIKRGVDPNIIEINNLGRTSTFNERKVTISW